MKYFSLSLSLYHVTFFENNFFFQLREMEVELEEERKLRQSAQASKRKLDGQVSDLEAQLENANKIKEEGTVELSKRSYQISLFSLFYTNFYSFFTDVSAGTKALKKYMFQLKEVQKDLDESRASRDDLSNQVKENEKKLKQLETEFLQMQEDLAAAERARRAVEQERDELLEELNSNSAVKAAIAEERKRWEAQIAALEEELEEERTQSELMQDKVSHLILIHLLYLRSK